jgi:hypothetical protein
MHLITKKTFRFTQKGAADVVVRPSAVPQQVPDGIAEDPLLKLACKDGSITVVQVEPSPADDPAGPADPAAVPQSPAPAIAQTAAVSTDPVAVAPSPAPKEPKLRNR